MPNGASTNYTNDVQKTVVLSGVVQNEKGTPISGVKVRLQWDLEVVAESETDALG
jgi:hypothetical protein